MTSFLVLLFQGWHTFGRTIRRRQQQRMQPRLVLVASRCRPLSASVDDDVETPIDSKHQKDNKELRTPAVLKAYGLESMELLMAVVTSGSSSVQKTGATGSRCSDILCGLVEGRATTSR
jgi:hypothetical protein